MYKKYTKPLPSYGMWGSRKTSWDGPAKKKPIQIVDFLIIWIKASVFGEKGFNRKHCMAYTMPQSLWINKGPIRAFVFVFNDNELGKQNYDRLQTGALVVQFYCKTNFYSNCSTLMTTYLAQNLHILRFLWTRERKMGQIEKM